MRNFVQGQSVRLKVTFRDFDRTVVDPSVVTFSIRSEADGEWNEYNSDDDPSIVLRESEGIWYLDVDTSTTGGTWSWRATGSGTTPIATQGQFYVTPSNPDVPVIIDNLTRRMIIDFRDFHPDGTGDEDDHGPLMRFVNEVKANPHHKGLIHEGIFATTLELPNLNVNGITLIGTGASDAHNVAPHATGSVVKWVGSAGGTVWQSTPTEGALLQYLTGVNFKGITIDCNSGLADYGFIAKSHRRHDFDWSVLNAAVAGSLLGVVTTLGDPTDMQDGRFRYFGRQWEAAGGLCLKVDGNASANVSYNHFSDLTCLYKDTYAVDWVNPDHNDYAGGRLFKHPGGVATNSGILRGGTTAFNIASGETFRKFSLSQPILAGGTDSFSYPSLRNRMTDFDPGNSGFDDAFERETGAIAYSTSDNTPIWNALPVSYTPVIASQLGAFGSITEVFGVYTRTPHGIDFVASFVIADIGTAASSGSAYFTVTLPFDCGPDWAAIPSVMETTILNDTASGLVPRDSGVVYVRSATGAFIGGTGYSFLITGSYKTDPTEL